VKIGSVNAAVSLSRTDRGRRGGWGGGKRKKKKKRRRRRRRKGSRAR